MAYDKNISPVGWYYGSYVLRFIELAEAGNDDPEKRFLVWENTVLVKAKTLETAYRKVERIGKSHTKPYRGGDKGVRVKWVYVGVSELLPVYDPIEDGVEIAWTDHRKRKLKTLSQWVRPVEAHRR